MEVSEKKCISRTVKMAFGGQPTSIPRMRDSWFPRPISGL